MDFEIRYSPRRRRITLRVTGDGTLEVLAPLGVSENDIRQLLHQHAATVQELQKKSAARKLLKPKFSETETLFYLGEKYPLSKSSRLVCFDGERFMLPALPENECLEILEKLYRKLAVEHLIPRAKELAELFGVSIGTVRINGALTRWGSCSADGNLNFSWHLVRCPEELVDSVICHELAHRFELNHSPRFYRQLKEFDPLFAEHRTALRRFIRQNPWFV